MHRVCAGFERKRLGSCAPKVGADWRLQWSALDDDENRVCAPPWAIDAERGASVSTTDTSIQLRFGEMRATIESSTYQHIRDI